MYIVLFKFVKSYYYYFFLCIRYQLDSYDLQNQKLEFSVFIKYVLLKKKKQDLIIFTNINILFTINI